VRPLPAALLMLAAFAPARAADPPLPAAPKEVRKVYGDGRHNAFTAFVKYRDAYWLAFRTAKDHNSADGDILVLTSPDAAEWKEAFRLDVDKLDDRDPQFLVAGSRLILYDAALKGRDGLVTYATHTDDGKTWSKPAPVKYDAQFFIWKPTAFNGRYYSGAHKKDESTGGKGRAVHLVTSADGLAWEKVSVIRAGSWESETTLHFAPGGAATAFLRQKYGSPQAQILESKPPYTEWAARPAGVPHFSGHSCHTIDGVTYLLTRSRDGGGYGQIIYTLDGGKLTPYCRLPAGGDCAYAEAVKRGGDMLVSYYSTHEGATNVYLATVPLKK